MDFIDIDNIKTPYSNIEVYKIIKHILKNEPEPLNRWSFISYFIQYISDENLLTSTIGLFKEIDFLNNKLETKHITVSNNNAYTELEKIKISAITHSLILSNEINLKKFSRFIPVSNIPELQLKLDNRRIEHNSTELENWIKRNSVNSVIDTAISLPKLKDRENEIKKLIQSMSGNDYLNDTETFIDEIDYLDIIKENLIEQTLPTVLRPKHEHVFSNNGFELFEYLLEEKHIQPKDTNGRFTDISFYYRKMVEDKYIHQNIESFKIWFFETYEQEDIGKIKTLRASYNTDREKHYFTALKWFKS